MTSTEDGKVVQRVLRAKATIAIMSLGTVVGVLYLGRKAIVDPFNGVDFKFLWVAGRVWAQGHNPYDPSYGAVFAKAFGYASSPWPYPPNWLPIVVPLSILDAPDAELLWRVINFGFALAIVALGVMIARHWRPQHKALPVALILLLYISVLQAVPICISTGQTSLLVTFGAMLFYLGIVAQRTLPTVLGVAILTLKPQLAVVPIIGAFALDLMRRDTLIGLATSAAISVPALVIGGFRESTMGFLSNVQAYGEINNNPPMYVTGLEHIANRITGFYPSSLVWIGFAGAAAATIGLARRRYSGTTMGGIDGRVQVLLITSPVLTCFFIPLHSYDNVILASVVLITLLRPYPGNMLMVVGLTLSFRPSNLIQVFGLVGEPSQTTITNLALSIAYSILLVGAMIFFFKFKSPARLIS
jgi:hypothetical protein